MEGQLRNAGLRPFFSRVVGGDQVQKSKPEPDIFLRALAGTDIAPGETVTVTLHVTRDSLASWDEDAACWTVESGRYRFMACRDAASTVLKKRVRI